MIFKRRDKQRFIDKARDLLWPRMGWRRMVSYYKHRTIRIPAGEHSIACGVALGCLVSWTPTFGTHLLQCLLYCWMFRGNFMAAFIGSAFGNLWTTPFLMFIAYQTGKFMLMAVGLDHMVMDYTGDLTLEVLQEQGMKVFLPTLIGGYTVGILTFPLFYYPTYFMVKGAKAARRELIERKLHREALDITGQEE